MGATLRNFFAIVAASVSIAGCGVNYPGPVVVEVQPERGWNGADTVLAISGRNFYPQVWVEAGAGKKARVDDGFTAYLVSSLGEEFELAGSINGYDRMDAVVKAGLAPGQYDVIVEAPGGARGELVDGFRVTDTIADRIVLANFTPTSVVGTAIAADVYLVDPFGERVHEVGFGVDIWLEDRDGAVYTDAFFFATEFSVAADNSTAGHFYGDLNEQTRIHVTVDDPGLYTLHATPQRSAGVAGDDVLLQWNAGVLDSVQLTLPSSPFTTTVGQSFPLRLAWVDVFGNPVPGHFDTVFLASVCTGVVGQVDVLGSAVVDVTLERPCAADQIFSIRDSAATTGPFVVLPAPPNHIEVVLLPNQAVAGVPMDVLAVVRDDYDNPVDLVGTVSLSANTGGLLGASCVKDLFNIGQFECVVTPTVAAEVVRLTASSGGLSGSSVDFDVIANAGSIGDLEIELAGQPLAGQPVVVAIRPVDSWDNPVDATAWAPGDWVVDDDLGEVSCTAISVAADGRAETSCTLYTARSNARLEAQLTPVPVGGTSADFTVVNGPLATVQIALPGGTSVQAGSAFPVDLAGFDAYGNPTTQLAAPGLVLADDTGTISPVSATLDASGQVQVLAALTRAGTTTIRASQATIGLGQSPLVTVLPAATAGLTVALIDAPWAWVAEPVTTRVEAVDTYGNRTSWSGPVTLDSRLTNMPIVPLTVTNGVGAVSVTWSESAVDEVLDASGGAWTGASAPLDVAMRCGASGPVAAVSFGGFPEAIACLNPVTGRATVSASFGASLAGSNPITRYNLASEAVPVIPSNVAGILFELPGAGIYEIRGLVMDAVGCGDEIWAAGYAGPDDGEPVGPVALSVATDPIVAGLGSTRVDVLGLTDCSRDPAQGASVRVRTTIGELVGPLPTGAGLAVVTDAAGDATFTMDALFVDRGGEAILHAWVPSGAAAGTASVTVTGDDQRPTVWAQSPDGDELSVVSSVEIQFSEPMNPSTLNPISVGVTGPYAVNVSGVVVDGAGTLATVSLSPPADGFQGAWTVGLTSVVRDAQGNRLSGDWSGNTAAYAGIFGDVDTAVDAVACGPATPASGRFRPDGDQGGDEQADQFDVPLATAVAPAWWEVALEVEATGERIRLDRAVPLGAVDSWSWDGRDANGHIVDNGSYLLTITPVDGLGNRGPSCSEIAVVDNALGGTQ